MSRRSVASARPAVVRPRHDPSSVAIGVVHIGPGAFHRAHQAAFLDDLLRHDPRWGIAAVSLRSSETVRGMAAQDGLYTLAVRDVQPVDRVIAAHRAWYGPTDVEAALRLLDDPAVRLVTATVTEKGYCRTAGGDLDRSHPDIAADRASPSSPRSLPGWLVAALSRRRASGSPPPVVMSCDNLPHNGAVLRDLVTAHAADIDVELAAWIAGEVAFPDTMVDAITPAPTATSMAETAARIGLRDTLAVEREAFSQWVTAPVPGATLPDLASVGAIVSPDVAGWETVKLRLLNGSHSALAYRGLLRGHVTVADAVSDRDLLTEIEAMAREEIVPTLPAAIGIDPLDYLASTLRRFANPAVAHRLDQIAGDGSQKLPHRLVEPLCDRLRAGRPVPRITRALAAWCAWWIGETRSGRTPVDPLAPRLARAARDADPCLAFLAVRAIFPAGLAAHPGFVADLTRETAALIPS